MTTYTVGSGVTSNGVVLQSGDSETVLAGGKATNTTISSGGLQNVSSGGTASGTTDYGEQQLFAGGIAIATTVEAGAVLYISGGSVSGAVVLNRGLEQLGGASTDVNAIVSSGGVQWAYTSSTVSGATLSGGTQIIGGLTSSTQFGALATAGGTATATIVDSGGEQFVGTGATASGTVLNSGGQQQVGGSTEWTYYYTAPTGSGTTMSTNLSGGVASGTTVNSGGVQTVHSGGTTIGTITYGEEAVGSGGVASATTVEAGGVLITGSSTESGTVVLSRGLEQLGSASIDTGTTVSAGGTQWLYNGAAATDATLNGGIQVIGGVTSSPNFDALTTTGGTASGTVVNSGGAEYVGTDATASGTVVNNGGTQQVGGSTEWGYYYQVSAGVAGATMSTNLSGGIVYGTTVNNGGTEVVGSGGTASGTTVSSGGLIQVASGGSIIGTDLLSGGTINLEYATYSAGATAVLNASTDVLTVTDGGNTYTLQLAGSYTNGFEVTSATNGSVDIILCFYPGTQLAGAQGNVAVEEITAGTLLKTASGELMPVRWVGQSHISTVFADHRRVLPIRIRAGALGDNLPERDLLVSPDHALFIGGLLIQASALVNGVSIVRETNVPEQFTYYHVELARHDLLLAEGVPAESFVDNVDRMNFHNWAEHEALAGLAPTGEMPYPRAKAHRQVPQAVRQMLEDRAGSITSSAAA